MTPPTCRTCKWFAGAPTALAASHCRRHAPTVVAKHAEDGRVRGLAVFPPVRETDWCGDHAIKIEDGL